MVKILTAKTPRIIPHDVEGELVKQKVTTYIRKRNKWHGYRRPQILLLEGIQSQKQSPLYYATAVLSQIRK